MAISITADSLIAILVSCNLNIIYRYTCGLLYGTELVVY